jgi:hypothetical protein
MWSTVSSNWWHSLHLLSVSVFNTFVAQLLLLLLLLLLLTAIELSLGGSTDKTSKKTHINATIQKTQYKQYKTQ